MASRIHTKLKRTAKLDKSACAVPSWEGDTLCDDVNNNEGCNWDGGDCCQPHTWTFWNLFCEVTFRNQLKRVFEYTKEHKKCRVVFVLQLCRLEMALLLSKHY